eukprot:NODE_888_length_1577_cov_65.286207_g877_i0.p1 GENE.NODE_888_length_1577_cov_65.286207_g877_i0~~NODE_888_length_1577_cov_65.286207_g877_i0.p1  ORF type:complete len:483 (-),score=39.04 NODE_888_length_1577_cov_65.286207_g877_i0:53-1501(-)
MQVALALLFVYVMAITGTTVTLNSALTGVLRKQTGFNFDWHLNDETGWVNSSVLVIPLDRLQYLVSQLAPSILRIGGSEGNVVLFDDGPPVGNTTFNNVTNYCPGGPFCLSKQRWDELNQFCIAAGCRIAMGLNPTLGKGGIPVSYPNAPWDSANTEALLRYSAERNFPIFGWEVGNELQGAFKDVDPFVTVSKHVRQMINTYWPNPVDRPKLIGPDENPNPAWIQQWAARTVDMDVHVDIVTVHIYSGYGLDPNLAHKIPTKAFLDKPAQQMLENANAARSALPNAEMWVGETAAAWHSGQNGTTNAFISSVWYVDQLASGATKANVTHQCRQTLYGGEYELIDKHSFLPNPDYFTLLLWKAIVGDRSMHATSSTDTVRAYYMCGAQAGTVVVVMLNIGNGTTVQLQATPGNSPNRLEYHLTAESPHSRVMRLNGNDLTLTADGKVPSMIPSKVPSSSSVSLHPLSIVFAVLTADVQTCVA